MSTKSPYKLSGKARRANKKQLALLRLLRKNAHRTNDTDKVMGGGMDGPEFAVYLERLDRQIKGLESELQQPADEDYPSLWV